MRKITIPFSFSPRFVTKVTLSFLTLSLCLGCLSNATANTDGYMQSQPQISSTPQRIVVFPLFAEEMLLEMIGSDRIVYVGHEYFENGEAYSPTMELTKGIKGRYWNMTTDEDILEVNPDLIVLGGDFRRDYREVYTEVYQANIPFLFLDTPKTTEDIMNTLVTLGDVVGAPERASQMMRNMEASLERIADIVAGIPKEKRARVTHYKHSDPECFIANNFHIIAHTAGVISASGSDTDYMEMNEELLVEWDPELITVNPYYLESDGSLYDFSVDDAEEKISILLNAPTLSDVTAIRNRNVHPLSLYESQFIVQSIMDLVRLAYPDLFPEN
jgi:ABC-type Fe3+-hydroxamate transport system substrate-binding protein